MRKNSNQTEMTIQRNKFRKQLKEAKSRMTARGHEMGSSVTIAPEAGFTQACRATCRSCGAWLTLNGNVVNGASKVQEPQQPCKGAKCEPAIHNLASAKADGRK